MEATGTKRSYEDVHNMVFHTVYEYAVDPFSFLTIASVCMGIFRTKFLPECWSILSEEEAQKHPNCSHEWDCSCIWLEGRKLNGFQEIEVLLNGEWVSSSTLKIHKKKFVKSPIGIVPTNSYSGDRHSRESLEWLAVLEKEWSQQGKTIKIQHARSTEGEKIVTCKGKSKVIKYKLDGYFEYDGQKYACEYNGCNWHGCPDCFLQIEKVQ